ncbi:aminopeptidase N [Neptuniibacter sp. CAU 1671]|uniref:aminopeptidase N n=1 Tax=Neptuniibacter sp. CAU 1671 TaxID=3032593 RepID=UPI0023D99F6B|nr:aminopeptidase N [Neptuniibacter sp. CAU 1671]MDF2182751.1 aminopeptidase N [Neptuniibacter sp. CAU 1671]
MSQSANVIYLKDYKVPAYLLEQTTLKFELYPTETLVSSSLSFVRNPECTEHNPALTLLGHEDLELVALSLNGKALAESAWQREGETMIVAGVPESFTLDVVTRILPQENTALEGLYLSDGMYCTQCEAEGFRRITFYPDRPDVMSVFTTTVEADQAQFPVLLSNGNPVASGQTENGRHWVTWEDPFPKPAYLFALVAGDLTHIEDHFTTASGRDVLLRIYAEAKDLDKLEYAMESLKRAMRWDEEVYGREYDLDIYMIVAVDFFNMGAMENKGLNVFNTSCVLAHPSTTTDAAFQRVEGVVAHEYFHNWSGNRVTCRDWFQLSLKEGFTVFRDAEFSADTNSRTVKRVEDVALLRTAQFAEDAGPMSHPIRPESFIEISNFYTLTVYEKGAEVVRMIRTLLGEAMFRKGSDLYFERHDGQAVTTDDFVKAMEDASGRDLSQFKRWYSQAGTPELTFSDHFDAASGRYTLSVAQRCPATPGQPEKLPYHMPLAVGLIGADGQEVTLDNGATTQILELTDSEQSFVFEGLAEKPVPSLLRGFSAPVKFSYPYTQAQLMFLMAHDTDGFARWDASQQLVVGIMHQLMAAREQGDALQLPEDLVTAFRAVLTDTQLDPAMVAKVLTLPSEAYLAELASCIDVDAIHEVRCFLRSALAEALEPEWLATYNAHQTVGSYSPDAESIAHRSLKNLALSYLMALETDASLTLAMQQYESSDNMTDMQAAFSLVVHSGFSEAAAQLLGDFYQRWQNESLVVNQWFAIQATDPKPGALARVKALLQHPAFDRRNPNKLRALIGNFCAQNKVNFHAADGSGYNFLAEQILLLNQQNPQVASRLLTPLTGWKKYPENRQILMKQALEQIMACKDLSKDVYEVVSKSLA